MFIKYLVLSLCLLIYACSSEPYYGNYSEVSEKQELVANLPDDKEYKLEDIKIKSHEETIKEICLSSKANQAKYKDLDCKNFE